MAGPLTTQRSSTAEGVGGQPTGQARPEATAFSFKSAAQIARNSEPTQEYCPCSAMMERINSIKALMERFPNQETTQWVVGELTKMAGAELSLLPGELNQFKQTFAETVSVLGSTEYARQMSTNDVAALKSLGTTLGVSSNVLAPIIGSQSGLATVATQAKPAPVPTTPPTASPQQNTQPQTATSVRATPVSAMVTSIGIAQKQSSSSATEVAQRTKDVTASGKGPVVPTFTSESSPSKTPATESAQSRMAAVERPSSQNLLRPATAQSEKVVSVLRSNATTFGAVSHPVHPTNRPHSKQELHPPQSMMRKESQTKRVEPSTSLSSTATKKREISGATTTSATAQETRRVATRSEQRAPSPLQHRRDRHSTLQSSRPRETTRSRELVRAQERVARSPSTLRTTDRTLKPLSAIRRDLSNTALTRTTNRIPDKIPSPIQARALRASQLRASDGPTALLQVKPTAQLRQQQLQILLRTLHRQQQNGLELRQSPRRELASMIRQLLTLRERASPLLQRFAELPLKELRRLQVLPERTLLNGKKGAQPGAALDPVLQKQLRSYVRQLRLTMGELINPNSLLYKRLMSELSIADIELLVQMLGGAKARRGLKRKKHQGTEILETELTNALITELSESGDSRITSFSPEDSATIESESTISTSDSDLSSAEAHLVAETAGPSTVLTTVLMKDGGTSSS